MTGQSLLDRMELVNAELQLQSGEADVVRGLLALNVAQDHFESLAAVQPGIFDGSVGTITTTLNTESTAYPSGLLRLDRLQYIDPGTSRPAWDLDRLQRPGGHAANTGWVTNLYTTTSTGKPVAYWTDGSNIYWSPLPSGTHTIRYYGFVSASDISASGTFAYPDIAALPLAAFAAKLMRVGIDDGTEDISTLAAESFKPVLDALANFNRDGAKGLHYTRIHTE